MTQNEFEIYFNWSCNLLVGEPIATDAYLKQNIGTVKRCAIELLRIIEYTPQKIYRGIVMTEHGLTELKPHNGFTYLSFSEDFAVAKIFADPMHNMAVEIRKRIGSNLSGYITEYTPQLDEILFHHKFLKMFPYVEAILEKDIDASRIHTQQEVTILQPSYPLILNQYGNTNKEKVLVEYCNR